MRTRKGLCLLAYILVLKCPAMVKIQAGNDCVFLHICLCWNARRWSKSRPKYVAGQFGWVTGLVFCSAVRNPPPLGFWNSIALWKLWPFVALHAQQSGEMVLAGEHRSTWRKTTNLTRINVGPYQGFRGEKPANNSLSHSTANFFVCNWI